MKFLPVLLCTIAVIATNDGRRVRVRPLPQEEGDEGVEYYTPEPQEDDQRVVYISSVDQYNGLYGQPSAASRSSQQDNYIPSRQAGPTAKPSKTKETNKQPPVQTIRNYNKVNDDGSFTFGYEAADGSFKEETRGTDCVVRGKYGYVDPDGNKREFTYVSGNPCDPNAAKDEELRQEAEEDKPEADSGPANYPTRPIRPLRPVTVTPVAPKAAVTLFQNNYAQGQEEEEPEPEQVLKPQPVHIRNRPVYITRPQYESEEAPSPVYRPRPVPTTPAPVYYKSPLSITPRPSPSSSSLYADEPATTYRPQLIQVQVTPRPVIEYKQPATPRPALRGSSAGIDFDAEFQKFQQENNIIASTPSTPLPRPTAVTKSHAKQQTPGGPIYSSELVFDPSSGQYKTQLYQTLPQTEGEFTLSHRIQPYVHQPQAPQVLSAHQLQNQSPLYRQLTKPSSANNQALYQAQQAELQFQNSAQLYAQQQKARAQTQQTSPQQFYYLHPQASSYQGGQIDAFLRNHNIQF